MTSACRPTARTQWFLAWVRASAGGRWRRLGRTQTRRNPSGISSGRGRCQAVIGGRQTACVLAGGATDENSAQQGEAARQLGDRAARAVQREPEEAQLGARSPGHE